MEFDEAVTTAVRVLDELRDQGALCSIEQRALETLEQLRILLVSGAARIEVRSL